MKTKPAFVLSILATGVLSGVLFGVLSAPASAENWPSWRGPRRDAVSREIGLPAKWGKNENVVWRTELPGRGGSTPAIWEDRIFLTSVDGKDLKLMCFSTDGKKLWEDKVSTGNRIVRSDEGDSAAPSPSTDGEHVWAFFTTGDLACYTVAGKQVWKVNLQKRYGKFKIAFGMTSTPVLDGDRIYLQLIHGEGNPKSREAIVVALDKLTGKEIWKHDRKSDARGECEHSYASPTLYRDSKREFLITHGADFTVGHDLADGSELWRLGGLNPKGRYNPTLRFVSSPVAVPGMIVVPSAKGGPIVALRPGIKGDVTKVDSAFHWNRPRNTPDVSSPLIHDGLIYTLTKVGGLICIDAKTGKDVYSERAGDGRHRSSPAYADGKIFLISRVGVVTVVKPGRKFEVLAHNDMQEDMNASPAFSGGRMYLRTFKALYAIGKK
ncbi:MAG: PQQ-like beta-propeller repeat protein [Planctomycetes bacterium]|nr:PQQ-like beta-propeller repeat protein [Planctomycetota bacterium]